VPDAFQYAVIRVVPRIDRGECVNVGVIVFCRTRAYLEARIELDEARLAALAPGLDPVSLKPTPSSLARIAAGDPDAGPIAQLPQSERFHWLVAPSSTVIQTSPVHIGLSDEPEKMLDQLVMKLVSTPPSS
jgi:hypothetical protein